MSRHELKFGLYFMAALIIEHHLAWTAAMGVPWSRWTVAMHVLAALGLWRMGESYRLVRIEAAIVRRLHVVETLTLAQVLCTVSDRPADRRRTARALIALCDAGLVEDTFDAYRLTTLGRTARSRCQ